MSGFFGSNSIRNCSESRAARLSCSAAWMVLRAVPSPMPGTPTSRSGPARSTSATEQMPCAGSSSSRARPSTVSLTVSIDICPIAVHT